MLYTWSRDTIPSDEAMANSPKNPAHQLDVKAPILCPEASSILLPATTSSTARFVLTAML